MALLGEAAGIIGRGPELEQVDRFLGRMAGASASLLVQGDAGIGKTSIAREAVERAGRSGIRVLRSAPAESERTFTLGGLTDLLAGVGDAELDDLPRVQRDALEVALLRTTPSGQPPDQRILSVATAGVLRGLSTRGAILLAIDDAQWLDESTAGVIAYSVRRLADRPVGLLLAVRGAPTDRVVELAAAVPPERREAMTLGPLPLAALHQLFLARLGRSFPRLVLVRIEEASGGNPFYALEIGRELAASQASQHAGATVRIPESLGALLEARIEALPRTTRDVLLLAAIATAPTLEALGRAEPAAAAALEASVAAGITSRHGDVVRFAHPLLAQAVIQTTSPAELRRAHAALARTATSDEARARHLAGASDGPSERVAAALESAAATARNRGATLDAAALYDRAARLTPVAQPDAALRRSTLAAETLFIDVSEMVEADAILERAIRAAPAGPTRAEALSLRALTRYYHGDLPGAVESADRAVAEAGAGTTASARNRRATVLGRAAFVVMQTCLPRGAALAREGLRLIDGGEAEPPAGIDPDAYGNLLLLDASATFGLVQGMPKDEVDRARALMSPDGRSWEHDGVGGLDFGLARAMDDLDRAITMTHAFIAQKAGPGGDDPFNLVMLSELQLRRGDVAEARASAMAADTGYAREGADVYPAWRLRGLALVAAHDGRHDDARRLSGEGLELARQAGDLVQQLYHHHILGSVALIAGDPRLADAHLTMAAELGRAQGTLHPGRFKLDADRVEAALGIGDVDRARAIVESLERVNEVAPTPWTRSVAARSRGLLHAADGGLEAAVASLQAAVHAHGDLPMPLERGRTLLALGQLHRRRREKRLADERLAEAIAIFEGLGAAGWAERARAERARVGRRPRAPTDLTDTERRVAELAATGLSAREIGSVVFLAPKTVGNVLGRVYDKLGIHSRAELGARLGAGVVDRSG